MPHDPGAALRALHRPGDPFVLANAWDRGSARVLAALGAQAIGTTSAGFAFTRGLPDGAQVSLDETLAHAADLVAATPLPVSADLENGYAEAPEGVAETIRRAAEAGLAGGSIEDTDLPGAGAYAFFLAVQRIRAAAAAARALPRDFVLVARADGLLTGAYDLREATARLEAFAEAGRRLRLRAAAARPRGGARGLRVDPGPGQHPARRSARRRSRGPISLRRASRASASAPASRA